MAGTPFDSIESAQDYVRLLAEQVEEARGEIADDTRTALSEAAVRRVQALQLADYKLKQLTEHLAGVRRVLNDLRLLRRILTSDVEPEAPAKESVPAPAPESVSVPAPAPVSRPARTPRS